MVCSIPNEINYDNDISLLPFRNYLKINNGNNTNENSKSLVFNPLWNFYTLCVEFFILNYFYYVLNHFPTLFLLYR